MKAITIYQPWASLIMIGAKPYEFRRWDYRERERAIEGQRIVIHASVRAVRGGEIDDIFERMADNESSLRDDVARPLLERVRAALAAAEAAKPAYRTALALYRRQEKRPKMVGDPELVEPLAPNGQILPLAMALGTAIIGKPRRCTDLFGGRPDSDRIDHHMWAWPLTDIRAFDEPVEVRGLQGFWNYPMQVAA